LYRYRIKDGSDTELANITLYVMFAKEFGWTPEQIDNIKWDTLRKMIVILKAVNEEQITTTREMSKSMRI